MKREVGKKRKRRSEEGSTRDSSEEEDSGDGAWYKQGKNFKHKAKTLNYIYN